MHLKIITRTNTYRFTQQGEGISAITEPYVHVEVYTREDVVALFDQGREHLVHAFTYNGEEITGLSETVSQAILGFFEADGAWYLKQLHPPTEDNPALQAEAVPPVEASAVPPANGMGADPSQNDSDIGLITDPEQQSLLRSIQTLAERLRQIKPEAQEPWDRQIQKLLVSQRYFGVQDPAAAYAMGQEQLSALVEKAKAVGIPETVIQTNLEVVSEEELPDEDFEEVE